MAKPTSKSELVKSATEKFNELQKVANSFGEEEQNVEFSFDTSSCGTEAHWKRDKNLGDILIHIYEWHQLLINWEESNAKGIFKTFLIAPYTWKNYGEMNIEFWKKHQDTTLLKAKKILNDSHNQLMIVINKYSNEELFTKGFYSWTGTTSLGQYCLSVTASHYDWALKKIKKVINKK